jgi:gliding motility-associated-like protein
MKLFTRSFLLAIVLVILSFSARASASAHFTADVTSGCAPLVVHFTSTSTGTNSSATYSWNLDNGTPLVPTEDAATTYLTAGTYTPTLTVTDDGVTTSYVMTITVFPAPTVNFYASDTSVCPGTPVTFTSTTIAGMPGTLSYAWAFGDGNTSTAASPTDIYTVPGSYNVTLSATNSEGCVASLTKTGYIHVFTPPAGGFTASTSHFCSAPASVTFSSSFSGAAPLTYAWTFGDGGTGSGVSPTHSYSSAGAYTVTLIVTDADGCKDTVSDPSSITIASLHASFTSPDTACQYNTITFVNTSTPHISTTWTFGDGTTGYGDPGIHAYSTPGTYHVRMVISDGYCFDSSTRTIQIIPGPATSFTVTPNQPCPPPIGLTFTGTAPSGTTVAWVYGDGSAGAGVSSTHTYSSAGIDTVLMISTNSRFGCVDTVKQIINILDIIPNVAVTPYSGCAPLTVGFNTRLYTSIPGPGTSIYPYGISSYTWHFGDGTSSTGTGTTASHTYTAVGTYSAVETITTTNGCIVYDSVIIHVGSPPLVTFNATPTTSCYHDNEIGFFASLLADSANYFVWEFGDGSGESDSVGTVFHHYDLPGVFTVTLTAYYNGCPSNTVVRVNYITIDSPKSILVDNVYCSPPGTVAFGDSSLGDDTHLWIFGDGSTSTADDPTHVYGSLTTYTVTLTTYNARSGCRDTASLGLDLSRPLPTFTGRTRICKEASDTFTAVTTGGGASGFSWWTIPVTSEFGTTYDSSAFIDTFTVPGIYTIVMASVDQNNCRDTVTRTNYLAVAFPVVSFSVTPASGCTPLSVTFSDASTDVTGISFATHSWEFGDGATGSGNPISHTFTTAGTYTTVEVVTDVVGCIDSASLPLVSAYHPTASFSADNTFPCAYAPVTFTNSSSSAATAYWSFGDGDTSTTYSPIHAYTAAGTYTVKLVVTDVHGCTDSAVMLNYITVTRPNAAFHMDDSFSICPPLTVHFINTSTGAVGYNWTFGDGGVSVAGSPSDLYITTGLYNVQLVATDVHGCTDTAIGHVEIFGYAGAFTYTPDSGCAPLTVNFTATLLHVPSVVWDYADGTVSSPSSLTTSTHTYTRPGAYLPKLVLSDNTGCQNSSVGTDTIKVDAVAAGFTTNPNPVCQGVPFTIDDTSASYWSTIVSETLTFRGSSYTTLPVTDTIDTPGTYSGSITVSDAWGCTATTNANVTVYPPPVITTSPDTTICITDKATIYGYGGVSYVWSPASSIVCASCNPALASPSVVTQYTVVGTDVHGCVNTDTVSVFLRTKTTSRACDDTEICQGTAIDLWDTGATTYKWIPGTGLNNDHIWDPLAEPQVTTKYTIIAQLADCTPDTNYVTIVVHPLPTVDAGQNQTVVAGTSVQLAASGQNIYKYAWDNSGSLTCDSCANPIATPTVNTTYTVNVYTQFGCTNSDTVSVFLYCEANQIFVPNTFTPNNDGNNDVFYPRGKGVRVIKSFRIYNRWGQLLFERSDIPLNDYSNAWDGSYLGEAPRPDVYVWVIDAICDTGQPLNLKGDVTIIR